MKSEVNSTFETKLFSTYKNVIYRMGGKNENQKLEKIGINYKFLEKRVQKKERKGKDNFV